MKFISWNVNGLRAIERKGFLEYLADTDADVVFVQETKAEVEQLSKSLVAPAGWGTAFESGQRKGYSGVGVYFRKEPDEIVRGMGVEKFDAEGRVIWVRYGDICVFGNYFPNGGKGVERVDYKLEFYDELLKLMNELRRRGNRVVVCGDYNTAHHPVDIARPKQNLNTSGFLAEERAWLDRYVDEGWVDTWRHVYPERKDVYTWWSYRMNSRARNVGWRIDYFFVDEAIRERIVAADIYDQVEGSDHAPIMLELDA